MNHTDPDATSASPRDDSQWSALKADLQRYLRSSRATYPEWRARIHAVTEYGFLALCVYRFGRWIRTIRPRPLAWPLLIVYHVLEFMVHVLFGIALSTNSRIGPGLYIAHFGGIIVAGDLGSQCSITQGVTIGAKGAGRSNGYPRIGDRVYIGAGAMVIGAIRLGDDVVVGANTVVIQDIPDGSRVVSAPVRILPPRDAGAAPQASAAAASAPPADAPAAAVPASSAPAAARIVGSRTAAGSRKRAIDEDGDADSVPRRRSSKGALETGTSAR